MCDELNESNAYVDEGDGECTDEMTGSTLLREDVAKAREEVARYDKCEAYEEVTDETCVSRTGRRRISCRWKDINKGNHDRVEVRTRPIAREIKQKGTGSYFAGAPHGRSSTPSWMTHRCLFLVQLFVFQFYLRYIPLLPHPLVLFCSGGTCSQDGFWCED